MLKSSILKYSNTKILKYSNAHILIYSNTQISNFWPNLCRKSPIFSKTRECSSSFINNSFKPLNNQILVQKSMFSSKILTSWLLWVSGLNLAFKAGLGFFKYSISSSRIWKIQIFVSEITIFTSFLTFSVFLVWLIELELYASLLVLRLP